MRQLSVFIFKKQSHLAQEKKKHRETVVDAIFKQSLREFHMELIGMEAVLRVYYFLNCKKFIKNKFQGRKNNVEVPGSYCNI